MDQNYPPWHPHDHPDSERALLKASAELLGEFSNQDARHAFLRDTREAHRRLYLPLTPADHLEYAGNYRGSAGSLKTRHPSAERYGVEEGSYRHFVAPELVESRMDEFGDAVAKLLSDASGARPVTVFSMASQLFHSFGLIHPYLDGNGHIQRLVFAAAILEKAELGLSPNWTIHPRPYGIEMALAFEQEKPTIAIAKLLIPYVTGLTGLEA